MRESKEEKRESEDRHKAKKVKNKRKNKYIIAARQGEIKEEHFHRDEDVLLLI